MSAAKAPGRRSDAALAGAILCCAVGPAVLGAVTGSAIGGWLGIACAAIVAAAVGLVLLRRARTNGDC